MLRMTSAISLGARAYSATSRSKRAASLSRSSFAYDGVYRGSVICGREYLSEILETGKDATWEMAHFQMRSKGRHPLLESVEEARQRSPLEEEIYNVPICQTASDIQGALDEAVVEWRENVSHV
jgi:hypothetical protein